MAARAGTAADTYGRGSFAYLDTVASLGFHLEYLDQGARAELEAGMTAARQVPP